MKYTYLIVEENHKGEKFSEKVRVKFESSENEPNLFISKLRELLSIVEDKSREELSKRLICKILIGNDQVWSCFVDEKGRFLGDEGPES